MLTLRFSDVLNYWWTGRRDAKGWGPGEEIFAAASEGNVAQLEDLVSRGVKVDAQVGYSIQNRGRMQTRQNQYCSGHQLFCTRNDGKQAFQASTQPPVVYSSPIFDVTRLHDGTADSDQGSNMLADLFVLCLASGRGGANTSPLCSGSRPARGDCMSPGTWSYCGPSRCRRNDTPCLCRDL